MNAKQWYQRRSLHQPPFFPQNSLPPSDPPSLSPPSPKHKFPFSSSTPKASPFFPTYPSPPPPPPSPITFVSFPANLSSLVLPHRHTSTYPSKLLAAAAVSTAAVFAALALFCYFRRQRAPELADGKGLGGAKQKQRLSSTSSEFLYLETLVSSRRVDEGNVGAVSKLDSPELRPLPPLSRQSNRSCRQNCGNGYVSSTADEDEEFYSPRGSLGGGFESSRSYDVVGAENFESRISHSSSSSNSSSTSGSPARSHSISLSPPVSLSPRESQPKSPKPVTFHSSSSSERESPPPRKSGVPGKYLRSPTLSPEILSAPPNPEASLRLWNAPGLSVHSPVLSMTSSSSELNAYATNTLSPATTLSPDRGFDLNPDASWAQNDRSPARSVDLNLTEASSPEMSPVMVQIQNVESLESVANASPKPISAPAPPRPPPLPPQKSKPIAQLSSQPPPLAPPSRPFVFQNRTKVSPEKMEGETPKPKLKPLHWDKVRASSGRDMVWDHLGSSSFKLNEEMIESLFIVHTPESKPKETKTTHRAVLHSLDQDNRVLDPKRSQNIAISLRALNVAVDEVCEALLDGNAETLGTQLFESLTKMAPTKEEERKLRDFKEDSPIKLGPAEKFLKAVLDVPFAFKRVESMLYMTNFQTEVEYLNKSFQTLEVACEELRNSRMFLKLLEAVLKTGNRMNVGTNRGDAHAFKLDTLLKLIDVKGADGKTTLLHFVVQEIIRTEGARLSSSEDVAKCRNLGLQIVSGLSSELVNVKKVASMDSEVLSSDVSKLSRGIRNLEEVLSLSETTDIGERTQRFSDSMNEFKKIAEKEIIKLQARVSVALSHVKEVTEYFHGNSAREEAQPLRIFMVVRDFLSVLDRVCKEVGVINERIRVSSVHKCPIPINPIIPQVVPVFPERKLDCSSDDESSSECSF